MVYVRYMRNNLETKIADDDLHYTSKESGSPFQDSSCGATISCYKCGRHKPRTLGTFKNLMGQRLFKCAECVLAATKD